MAKRPDLQRMKYSEAVSTLPAPDSTLARPSHGASRAREPADGGGRKVAVILLLPPDDGQERTKGALARAFASIITRLNKIICI